MAVSPIPPGYSAVTPYLIVGDGAAAIDFYKRAFNAEEVMRLEGPGGSIGHAEVKIGGAIVMLASAMPEMGITAPTPGVRTAVGLCLYVPNVDEVFAQAVAAGGTVERELNDQFYGDRNGIIHDPFGHSWTIGTHLEDMTPEEITRRAKELYGE